MSPKEPFPMSSSNGPQPDHDADARELEDYLSSEDPVAFEAALWATRRHEGLSPAAEAEFHQWLAAEASHRAAFESMEPSYAQVQALPHDRLRRLQGTLSGMSALPDDSLQDQPTADVPAPSLASAGRRAWMLNVARFLPPAVAAAAAVAVAGGHWLEWDLSDGGLVHTRRYTTARGELRELNLPDGSIVALDASTVVRVAMRRNRREVQLLEGQAMFTVARDADNPFDVLAGGVRVTVVGTRFSVRHTSSGLDAGNTVIAVESGRVRVSRVDAPRDAASGDGLIYLGKGEGVTADAQGALSPIARFNAESVGSWRLGRVSFNDTPLAQAVAEFERYGDTHLRVRDPAVAALRLGGTFDLKAAATFAQALPHLLPVRLVTTGQGTPGEATEIVKAN